MVLLRTHESSQAGFTLIELMVVVIITAVLMAIALPAYQNQVIRGNRAAAKAAMMDIANRQEQYLLSNRSYAGSVSDLGYALPTEVSNFYVAPPTLSTIPSSPMALPYFKITLTPKGSQQSDGDLELDSQGVRTPSDKWER
jgi:type IV pilus assembly protein PilE